MKPPPPASSKPPACSPCAIDVPARHQDRLAEIATDLSKDAQQLLQAAKGQDVKLTNEALQRINLKVRELRP